MNSKALADLVSISHLYGENIEYVIAGGGNTSYKNDDYIWVKASGTSLLTIDVDGFVCLAREGLKLIQEKSYSLNSTEREKEVKDDLAKAILSPKHLRPSVETSMHEIIDFSYIVHTHPTFVNALMCSKNAEKICEEIFGKEAMYIEYTDPGYVLFKKVLEKLNAFKESYGTIPSIIFLQNHGVFVGGDTIDEIEIIYSDMERKLKEKILNDTFDLKLQEVSTSNQQIIHNYFAKKSLIAKGFSGEIIQHFISSSEWYSKISKPFTPDIIVYCKSNYLFLEKGVSESEIIESIESFSDRYGYFPKLILLENDCMVVIDDSDKNILTIAEVFLDMMKISHYSENFGGPNFMTKAQIEFIDNWEVENYRRKIAKEG